MHGDYFFRSHEERSATGWQGYRGAVPAKLTMGLLGVGLLWHLVLFGGRLLAPMFFSSELAAMLGTYVTLALYVLTAIVFLVWFYRAYMTVNLAVGTVHSPDHSVWTFLVPVLNLFRPYQIATEIWRKAGPGDEQGHSPLLVAWWALWIVGFACPLFLGASVVANGNAMSPMALVLGLAELTLTISALMVVRMLDARIRARQAQGTAPATF